MKRHAQHHSDRLQGMTARFRRATASAPGIAVLLIALHLMFAVAIGSAAAVGPHRAWPAGAIPSLETIAVRFQSDLTPAGIQDLVREEEQLQAAPPGAYWAPLRLQRVTLANGACAAASDLETLLTELAARPEIALAVPVLELDGAELVAFDEVVLRARPGTAPADMQDLAARNDLRVLRRLDWAPQIYVLADDSGLDRDPFQLAAALESESEVDFCEPHLLWFPDPLVEPGDEYFVEQWNLHNTGQSGGSMDADIDAPEAWEITSGETGITIAVIDDGVDLVHEDLAGKIVTGYDAVDGDDDPTPNTWDGHGTACCGIAAATSDNGAGIASVDWGCRVMPIRVMYSPAAGQDLVTTNLWLADGIAAAATLGADVLQCGWGLPPETSSELVEFAVDHAHNHGRDGKGCVLVAAAGNTGGDVHYPANLEQVMAVGATDHNDDVYDYSSHGPELDVVAPSGAPGLQGNIWTTDISGAGGYNPGDTELGDAEGDYCSRFGGTSGASPLVAGLAALVLSRNPSLDADSVQAVVEAHAEDKGNPGWDELYGHGRINARDTVENVGPQMIFVHGTLADTTWTSNTIVRITGDTHVPVNTTLTIEPAVEVRFDGFFYLQVDGRILAHGDSLAPVVFTSNQADPPPGAWQGLVLAETSDVAGCEFVWCRFEYAQTGLSV
ncbi:MAG: S8 family serine peptidase, partial [Candidatus Eisenbacteria bacterium]|nr:S8 family serine peptidase [Candidatus Eisenbacteria bacterium]